MSNHLRKHFRTIFFKVASRQFLWDLAAVYGISSGIVRRAHWMMACWAVLYIVGNIVEEIEADKKERQVTS